MRQSIEPGLLGRWVARGAAFGFPLIAAASAFAQEATEAAAPTPVVDSGDTAWILAATGLVLMMTLPGLALFYGGLVRAKNVLNVFMQCFIAAGVVGVLWILVGYSLAFGQRGASFIGTFARPVSPASTLDSWSRTSRTPPRNIPEYIFVMFQGMFAIITPGADPRRGRRAHEVLGLPGLHLRLAAHRLLPARPHGLGRRLDLRRERHRLRRRPRRAHVERLLGARRGDHARQAQGLRQASRCRRTACRCV